MVALMSMLFAFSFDILKYSEMSCIDAQTLIDRVYEYNQHLNSSQQKMLMRL